MNTPVSALLARKGSAVYAVPSTSTIAEAVAEMNNNRVGCIVLVDNGTLVGIFTERDVLRRVVGAGIDPSAVRVADVMTNTLITITRDTTVEEAMTLFTERRCRHLPVMEGGVLLGLISIGDVSRWVSDLHRAEAENLKSYITGGLTAV